MYYKEYMDIYKEIGREFSFICFNGDRKRKSLKLYELYDNEISFLIERYSDVNKSLFTTNPDGLVNILKDEQNFRRQEKILKLKECLKKVIV